MLFSIIMPTYNRAFCIGRAISSVISQTYQDWELLIIDDGSSDGTEDAVKAFSDSRIIYHRYDQNRGGNHARNIGISMARGEYLAFLDSDNEWLPRYLEMRAQILKKNTSVNFIYGSEVFKGSGNQEFYFPDNSLQSKVVEKKDLQKKLIFTNRCDTNAIVIEKSLAEKAGRFDENLRRFQDWEFVLRLVFLEETCCYYSADFLCIHHREGDSITGTDALYKDARLYIVEEFSEKIRKMRLWPQVLAALLNDRYLDCGLNEIADAIHLSFPEEVLSETVDLLQHQIITQGKKNRNFQTCLFNWVLDSESGKGLLQYLTHRKYKRVAVYGMGYLGKTVVDVISSSDIEIVFAVDKYIRENFYRGIPVLHAFNKSERQLDCMINTVIAQDQFISQEAELFLDCPCVSINEIFANR